MKYTPGPWKFKRNYRGFCYLDNIRIFSINKQGHKQKLILEDINVCVTKEIRANWLLMAAAPEMFEIIKQLNEEFQHEFTFANLHNKLSEKIKKIIAKAEGKKISQKTHNLKTKA